MLSSLTEFIEDEHWFNTKKLAIEQENEVRLVTYRTWF